MRQGDKERGREAAGDEVKAAQPMPFTIEDRASQPSDEPSSEPPAPPIEIPLVMPSSKATPFWRRRGHRFALAVTALVLFVAGRSLYQRFVGDGPGSSTTFGSISLEELAPELSVVAEAFRGAASRYAERREDFELGRLGCEGLWTGYRGVDEAFIALSEQHASLGGGEVADRVFASSRRSMEEIGRHYEATECPRGN